MPREPFESEVEALFAQAGEFDDADAFVDGVSHRIGKLRRAERLVHGFAFTVGGLIAILELSQPSLWEALGGWTQRATGYVAQTAPAWPAPDVWGAPIWGAFLGAVLLSVYVGRLLREN